MIFLAILLALGGLQLWGSRNPLQRDGWFCGPLRRLTQGPWAPLGLTAAVCCLVVLPVAGLALVSVYSREHYWWLWLPMATAVLLYSVGRGPYGTLIADYIEACRAEQWAAALTACKNLGREPSNIAPGDWPNLHAAFLEQASYRGFERVFAVLFWFLLAGPAGALLYRLSALLAESQPRPLLQRWLWLMEWPSVRVLSLSFAFTGNFLGCVQAWRRYYRCVTSPSSLVIAQSVLGALSVGEGTTQTSAVTRRELMAMRSLFGRTLWFWLGTLALLTLRG